MGIHFPRSLLRTEGVALKLMTSRCTPDSSERSGLREPRVGASRRFRDFRA